MIPIPSAPGLRSARSGSAPGAVDRLSSLAGASFDERVEPHLDAMIAAATAVVGRHDLAADVVQEVLSRLWTQGHLPEEPRGALCHLARLAALQQLRSDRRRCHHESCADAERCRYESVPDPVSLVASREELLRVRAAMVRLSDEQREVLELHAVEGLAYGDVAQACGVPVGTVRSRLHRARRELSRLLGDDVSERAA